MTKNKRNNRIEKYRLNFKDLSAEELQADNVQDLIFIANWKKKSSQAYDRRTSHQNWIIMRQNELLLRQNEEIIKLLKNSSDSEAITSSDIENIHNQGSTSASNDDSRFFS